MSEFRRNIVLVGDVRRRLDELPADSVDCVITSPPYFQLRDYGVHGQIGLEPSIGDWVSELRLVMRGLGRVLKPSGSLWLNLGDTYSRHAKYGAPRKSLLLAPERLLLALAADGWIVRNKVIWAKTNPLPHSVSDRLNTSYDVVYFLTRSPSYWFDLDAIREPHKTSAARDGKPAGYPPAGTGAPHWSQQGPGNRGLAAQQASGVVGHELGKNPGDVWPLASANFAGQHFATFPPRLVERPLLATCPELICGDCGTPHRRETVARREPLGRRRSPERRIEPRVMRYPARYSVIRSCGPLRPRCTCRAASRPGVVLDPFFGAGTVGLVAERHRRDWIGIEINPQYAKLAERRVASSRRAPDGPSVGGTVEAVAPAAQPSIPGRGREP